MDVTHKLSCSFLIFNLFIVFCYVVSIYLMKTADIVYEVGSEQANTKDVVKHKNYPGSEYKEYKGRVPNVIIQYGEPRTATTLQFVTLCLMMVMLHEDEANSVGCYFNKVPSHKYTVIKTHNIRFVLQSLPKNAWIFMTAGGKRSPLYEQNQIEIEKQNRTVRYVVHTGMVDRRGHFIAYEYQSIFGVSNKQMSHVVTHLRYWDILRRCCGKQMSKDWRNHLSPEPNYSPHHDPRNITYPACEMYNISQVETLFINTYIYKTYTPITSLRNPLGKPSSVDGTLNGHYCEEFNKKYSKRHLRD